MQTYLNSILDSMLFPDSAIRMKALRVVQSILLKGLVHPMTCIPYLLALQVDQSNDYINDLSYSEVNCYFAFAMTDCKIHAISHI